MPRVGEVGDDKRNREKASPPPMTVATDTPHIRADRAPSGLTF